MPKLPLQWRFSELRMLAECDPDTPLAVIESSTARSRLIACSDHCEKYGIAPGLDAVRALAFCPMLRLLPRSLYQERCSLRKLTAWAGQFSSLASFDSQRFLLWLEVGTSLECFGGLDSLVERIRHGLSEQRYDAQIGIAPTLEAAALLAKLSGQSPASPKNLRHCLAELPSQMLPFPGAVIESLQASGLMTIGQVMSVPDGALARRFGQVTVDTLHRLIGVLPDVRAPFHAPEAYCHQIDLTGHSGSGEDLLPLLHHALDGLEEFLHARDVGTCNLTLRFQHEGRSPTRMTIRVSHPLRKAMHWLRLLRDRLERSALTAPVVEISLEASDLVPIDGIQPTLLEDKRHPCGDWPKLVDRLRARLGDAVVRQLGVRNDHRPEYAWNFVNEDSVNARAPAADRPLWLLDQRPLDVLPENLGAPERIEAGWWDGHDIARDYYRAWAASGSQMWLYRDCKSRQWYLHGLWA